MKSSDFGLKCPNCGYYNDVNSTFCKKCDTLLFPISDPIARKRLLENKFKKYKNEVLKGNEQVRRHRQIKYFSIIFILALSVLTYSLIVTKHMNPSSSESHAGLIVESIANDDEKYYFLLKNSLSDKGIIVYNCIISADNNSESKEYIFQENLQSSIIPAGESKLFALKPDYEITCGTTRKFTIKGFTYLGEEHIFVSIYIDV